MSRFSVVDIRVKELLEQFPETRENDHLLYMQYIETYYYLEFNANVFVNYKEYNVPPFSTIERSARDVKRTHKNLMGTLEIQENRKRAEAEYKQHYSN